MSYELLDNFSINETNLFTNNNLKKLVQNDENKYSKLSYYKYTSEILIVEDSLVSKNILLAKRAFCFFYSVTIKNLHLV